MILNYGERQHGAEDVQLHLSRPLAGQQRFDTTLKSIKLTFDVTMQKWRGSINGNTNTLFYVHAVDNAGNMTTENNKGEYYRAIESSPPFDRVVYLPMVAR